MTPETLFYCFRVITPPAIHEVNIFIAAPIKIFRTMKISRNKKIFMKKIVSLLVMLVGCYWLAAQNIGIDTTSPNSRTMLDVQSNNKGVLIPRMTTAQRKTIANPESGLMVFDTDKQMEILDRALPLMGLT